jgi:hypothetical protein
VPTLSDRLLDRLGLDQSERTWISCLQPVWAAQAETPVRLSRQLSKEKVVLYRKIQE